MEQRHEQKQKDYFSVSEKYSLIAGEEEWLEDDSIISGDVLLTANQNARPGAASNRSVWQEIILDGQSRLRHVAPTAVEGGPTKY